MKLSCLNLKIIFSGRSYISILIAGSLLVRIIQLQMNPQYDNRILPLTWVMLGFPVFFFSSVMILMTFLYAGVLIHRDRTSLINEIWVKIYKDSPGQAINYSDSESGKQIISLPLKDYIDICIFSDWKNFRTANRRVYF